MSNVRLFFHSVLNGVATTAILFPVGTDICPEGILNPWYWVVIVAIVTIIINSIIMGRN